MTEEIYKNGDIYYIKTLSGEIKMFDKDDNEINWTPTQNLGDKVIFYNQAYINEQTKRLEQDSKQLTQWLDEARRNADFWCDKCTSLEQENTMLKEERNQAVIHYNNLIAEIIADVPFLGIVDTRENAIDHLHKMQKALASLEEIREIINGHASPSACEYWGSYKNACEPCALRILNQVEDKIQNRINEVLNDN